MTRVEPKTALGGHAAFKWRAHVQKALQTPNTYVKEPYTYAQEPYEEYTCAKEPYTNVKEPYKYAKRDVPGIDKGGTKDGIGGACSIQMACQHRQIVKEWLLAQLLGKSVV